MTPSVLEGWLVSVPAVLAGLWIGAKLFDKIRIEVLRKTVYVFLGLSGVAAIVL